MEERWENEDERGSGERESRQRFDLVDHHDGRPNYPRVFPDIYTTSLPPHPINYPKLHAPGSVLIPPSPFLPIMAINIHDPLVEIKGTLLPWPASRVLTCLSLVTESVCGFVAICMTLLRLWLRRDRYWWDDAWAFFSLLKYVPTHRSDTTSFSQ